MAFLVEELKQRAEGQSQNCGWPQLAGRRFLFRIYLFLLSVDRLQPRFQVWCSGEISRHRDSFDIFPFLQLLFVGRAQPAPSVTLRGPLVSLEAEGCTRARVVRIEEQGFPKGELSYDYSDPESGAQLAILDLVWPSGLQTELSQPVAVLLNEGDNVLAIANQAGFRCFTSVKDFEHYVETDLLGKPA